MIRRKRRHYLPGRTPLWSMNKLKFAAIAMLIFAVVFATGFGGDDFTAFKEKRMPLPSREDIAAGEFREKFLASIKYDASGPVIPEQMTFNTNYYTRFNLMKEQYADLDNDGRNEHYTLRYGRLVVTLHSETIWQTPEEWWVDNFILADANNDGRINLNLSLWKAGSYGPCKPFWETGEDNLVRNHLFIFNLVDGVYKPAWHSSSLSRPNYELFFEDITGSGKNELVTFEGNYNDPKDTRVSVWKWNGWGFTRLQ